MTETLVYTGELTVLTCWCGMRHAVPAELRKHQLRQFNNGEDPVSVYCPLGHSHVPAGEGSADKLRKRLEAEAARTEYWRKEQERTERQRRAAKGQVTKAKKRAANGVCPHPECHRSFVDVARHVRSKHPELIPQLNAEPS